MGSETQEWAEIQVPGFREPSLVFVSFETKVTGALWRGRGYEELLMS